MKIGVDIGGMSIKFGVIGDSFEIIEKFSVPTPLESGEALVSVIAETCVGLKEKYNVDGIGIGTPGIVDDKAGKVVYASNIPFSDTEVVAPVAEKTGLPVRLGNDANCAMLGELYAGYGRECDNMLMITLGTGVGGGIIIDKKPYFGKNGNAGELGHMCVKMDGEPCGCGRNKKHRTP